MGNFLRKNQKLKRINTDFYLEVILFPIRVVATYLICFYDEGFERIMPPVFLNLSEVNLYDLRKVACRSISFPTNLNYSK
jgi:hypothetical protein